MATVEDARKRILDANVTFDREATRLHRRIEELDPSPPIENTVTPIRHNRTIVRKNTEKSFSLDGTEGWTDEEIAHYKRLKGKQRARA